MRSNGSVLWRRNAASTNSARGLWDLREQQLYRRSAEWPFVIDITTNLRAFWRLSDLNDSSGNSQTLTNVGSVQFVSSGRVGNAAQWNSPKTVTQYLSRTVTGTWSGDLSVSGWFFPLPFTNDSFKTLYTFGSSGGARLLPYIEQGGNLRLITNGSVPTQINTAMGFNAWHHIVLVKSGSNVLVYLNGNYVNQVPYTTALSGTMFLGIANDQTGGTGLLYEGRIDAVGVWSRALFASEVSNLYNSGNGLEI